MACRASVGVIFSLGMAHSRSSREAQPPGAGCRAQQHQMLIAAAGEVTDAGVANLGCRHQFFRRRIVRTQEVFVLLTSAGAFLDPARRPRLLHKTQAFRMRARYRARYFIVRSRSLRMPDSRGHQNCLARQCSVHDALPADCKCRWTTKMARP